MRLELSDYYIFNLTVYQSLIKKIDGIYRKANWIISVTLAIIIGLIVCHKNLPNQERGNFYLLFDRTSSISLFTCNTYQHVCLGLDVCSLSDPTNPDPYLSIITQACLESGCTVTVTL